MCLSWVGRASRAPNFLPHLLANRQVFRTNSSYDRWWEARKLWGGVVNRSRDVVRQVRRFKGAGSGRVHKPGSKGWLLLGRRLRLQACAGQAPGRTLCRKASGHRTVALRCSSRAPCWPALASPATADRPWCSSVRRTCI